MEEEGSVRIPGLAGAAAAVVLLLGAGALALGYSTGMIHALGHQSYAASGGGIGMSKAGSSWGFTTLPLGPGQKVVLDYDVRTTSGELWIAFHNYSSLPVALVAGAQHDFQVIRGSRKGSLSFQVDHWGLYRLDARPVCGISQCKIDYDLDWRLP